MNNEYSSSYYFKRSILDRSPRQPIGNIRYLHRARAVKRNDPKGVYWSFNLSNNKGFSDKPTTDRGEILFG